MYVKMVETRMLEERVSRLVQRSKAAPKWSSAPGYEACRVSVMQGLGVDDMVLDSRAGRLMDHLLGTKLPDVLSGIQTMVRRDKSGKTMKSIGKGSKRLLPFIADAKERLFAGLGAAMLLKQTGRTDGVVVYVEYKEASDDVWRKAFTLAAAEDLPVVFVAMPNPNHKNGKAKANAGVSGVAHDCGVPGIHVDSSDVIALYRVVQESWTRIRGGGGPVLIEGVPFHLQGEKRAAAADPIAQLGEFLLNRKVCTPAWLAGAQKDFRGRLAAAKTP
jgi:TPP-dependent pyruvate/acetoin dehydrogenase alpha subunit